MKKCNVFLSSVVALFLCTGYLHAQVFMVVKGETSTPYNDLEAAVAAAEAGSTVYIPTGGHFILKNPTIAGSARTATLLIDKKLNLIGAGANEGEFHNTVLQGDVTLTGEASGSRIEGLTITGYLRLDNVSNFLFRRCRCNNQLHLSGKGDGNVFAESLLQNILGYATFYAVSGGLHSNLDQFIGIHVRNCVITGSISYLRKGIFSNNVFTTVAGISGVHHSIFVNNIFSASATFSFTGGSTWNYAAHNLCVVAISAVGNDNVAEDNIQNVPVANIFVDQVRYHLKAGCPGIGAGSDGTDVGIYGGVGVTAKEQRIPGYPQVTEFFVSGTSTPDGGLPVKITVEAQEK